MKKLLLSLIFLSAVANIKTESSPIINEKNAVNEPMIVQEHPAKDKEFLDLSIKEIWNEKILPFIQSEKCLTLSMSALTIVQLFRFRDILFEILDKPCCFHRKALYNQNFLPNIVLLSFAQILFFGVRLVN